MTDVENKLNNSRVGAQSEYYRVCDKQLCNSIENLVASFEEELRYMIKSLMHMGMENAVINRNYIRPLQSTLISHVRQMLNTWVNSVFRYQKTTAEEIEKMFNLNEEDRDNKMAYLSSGIIARGIDPDTSSLSDLGKKYLAQFEGFFESYEKITGNYSSNHKQHLNDITMDFISGVKKVYSGTISRLADDLSTAYEEVIEEVLSAPSVQKQDVAENKKQSENVKQAIKVTDFPIELMPNITRILGMAGYELVKGEDKFYALEKSTGIRHEIVFTGSFNFFHFADDPQKHFWIDVQVKSKGKITDPQDTAWLGTASIFYTEARRRITILSKINNANYLLKLNDDQTITYKKEMDNDEIELTSDAIRAEIASLYPDVLATCEVLLGVNTPVMEKPTEVSQLAKEIADLEKQRADLDRLIEEKKKQLAILNNENPEVAFQEVLAEQKIDDMTFAAQGLQVDVPEMKVGI